MASSTYILAILVEAFKESCNIYLIYRVLKNIKLVFCIETCEKTAIDANPPDVVVTSLPKIPPSENGTELWCWSSNSPEPYLKVDFRAYCIICALQVSFNGMVEISYGNKSLNKSQVYTSYVLVYFSHVALVNDILRNFISCSHYRM